MALATEGAAIHYVDSSLQGVPVPGVSFVPHSTPG